MPTIIYKNVSKKKVFLPNMDLELGPGDIVSITAEFPQPILHEDLVNITDEESKEDKDEK